MAKKKVSELEGAELDYWVGKAADEPVGYDSNGRVMSGRNGDDYSPSTDWSQGGPIIEREGIQFLRRVETPTQVWDARHPRSGQGVSVQEWFAGPTPLIAAMRCFVAPKFGEEVEVE